MKKFQLSIFGGSQSFHIRSNAPKDILKFTGLKKLDSKLMAEYLTKLDKQIIDEMLAKIVKPKSEVSGDHLHQLKVRLVNMGANTEKQALKLIAKRTGVKFKKLSLITQAQAQQILAKILLQVMENKDD